MSIRLYLDDLPAGHAAAGRVVDGLAVIIVDRSLLLQARDRGDLEYGVRLANDVLEALGSGTPSLTLAVA